MRRYDDVISDRYRASDQKTQLNVPSIQVKRVTGIRTITTLIVADCDRHHYHALKINNR